PFAPRRGRPWRRAMTTVAAVGFAAVALGVVAFQVALALGAPWGAYAMGGAFPGRYTTPLRLVALAQAIAVAFLALVVLGFGGVIDLPFVDAFPWLAWVPVAFSALAVVLNAISRSAGERGIWVPVSVVLLATSLIVAVSSRAG
ncbi:MAG TPA: hypothetical protein VF119_08660, partial [Candidatus Limnocylindrales bacterium]